MRIEQREAWRLRWLISSFVICLSVPSIAWTQSSPFMTGLSSLQSDVYAWLTPIAILLVIVVGVMAMANRISWGWCAAAILGIAIAFGAPQVVSWVRVLFAV